MLLCLTEFSMLIFFLYKVAIVSDLKHDVLICRLHELIDWKLESEN